MKPHLSSLSILVFIIFIPCVSGYNLLNAEYTEGTLEVIFDEDLRSSIGIGLTIQLYVNIDGGECWPTASYQKNIVYDAIEVIQTSDGWKYVMKNVDTENICYMNVYTQGRNNNFAIDTKKFSLNLHDDSCMFRDLYANTLNNTDCAFIEGPINVDRIWWGSELIKKDMNIYVNDEYYDYLGNFIIHLNGTYSRPLDIYINNPRIIGGSFVFSAPLSDDRNNFVTLPIYKVNNVNNGTDLNLLILNELKFTLPQNIDKFKWENHCGEEALVALVDSQKNIMSSKKMIIDCADHVNIPTCKDFICHSVEQDFCPEDCTNPFNELLDISSKRGEISIKYTLTLPQYGCSWHLTGETFIQTKEINKSKQERFSGEEIFLMNNAKTGAYNLFIACLSNQSKKTIINYCAGCNYESTCVEEYEIINKQYCFEGQMNPQKKNGISCSDQSMCLSNYCSNENLCLPSGKLFRWIWLKTHKIN